MKWFKHDCDTSSDPKIKLLKRKFGVLGTGVYFEINRLIASNVQSDNQDEWGLIAKEYADNPELLEDEIGTTVKKINEITDYCVKIGLLFCIQNRIANPKILKRGDKYLENICSKKNIDVSELIDNLMKDVGTMWVQSGNSVPHVLDKNRLDKNRLEEDKMSTFSSIESLTETTLQEVAEKYRVPLSFVQSKLDDMTNWHNENPRKNNKTNWKATLMNWVKRDAIKIVTSQHVNKFGVTKV
jgi:hypothetical protein